MGMPFKYGKMERILKKRRSPMEGNYFPSTVKRGGRPLCSLLHSLLYPFKAAAEKQEKRRMVEE
jgi:hypothetical protein